MPRVSVVMGVYNDERFLREAIESILRQTFHDFEFIIIDDGSTDRSGEIVRSYDDRRIRLLVNECNVGLTRTLNRGLREAGGELIARQDSDDVSAPERLAKQVAYFDAHPDVALLGTWYRTMDADGHRLVEQRPPIDWLDIRWALLFHSPLAHSTVMFRRTVLNDVGFYDETLRYATDRDLWTRICRTFRAANLPHCLLDYRINPSSMTATYGERLWEGPRVSMASIARLLNWNQALDAYTDRFSRMERMLLGSPSDIGAESAGATVEELLSLQRAFCVDLALSPADAQRHRNHLLDRLSKRLVRAASYQAWRGQRASARVLLAQAWRLRRRSTLGWRGFKAAAFMVARRQRAAE